MRKNVKMEEINLYEVIFINDVAFQFKYVRICGKDVSNLKYLKCELFGIEKITYTNLTETIETIISKEDLYFNKAKYKINKNSEYCYLNCKEDNFNTMCKENTSYGKIFK